MTGAMRALTLLLAALSLLPLACRGGGDAAPPSPTPAPPAVEGPSGVQASLEARCRIAESGPEIVVQYAVRGFGSAQLQRVSVLIDGRVVTDSGPLAVNDLAAERTFGSSLGEHTVRLRVESTGSPSAAWRTSVRCGRDAPLGPRAHVDSPTDGLRA